MSENASPAERRDAAKWARHLGLSRDDFFTLIGKHQEAHDLVEEKEHEELMMLVHHGSDRDLLELLVELTIRLYRGQKDMAASIADLIQEVADNNATQVELIADVQALLTAQAAGNMTQDQIDSAVGTLETMKQNAKTAAASIETALGHAQSVPQPPAPTPVPVPTMTLSPTSASLAAGATQQFSASASDGSTPTWDVSPPELGTVDENGLFTAGAAAGSGVVVAETNGATISASVVVTA